LRAWGKLREVRDYAYVEAFSGTTDAEPSIPGLAD